MERETKEIRLESLLPFKIASDQTYVGERLEQLMGRLDLKKPYGNKLSSMIYLQQGKL